MEQTYALLRIACPPELNMIHMPVVEFTAPSLTQVEEFVKIVEQAQINKEKVVVHCHWGRGRTGTMLACYLVKHQNMSPAEAIRFVRKCRPYSIETEEQEEV